MVEKDLLEFKNANEEDEIKLKLPKINKYNKFNKKNKNLNPEQLLEEDLLPKQLNVIKDSNIVLKAMKRLDRLKSFEYKFRFRQDIML